MRVAFARGVVAAVLLSLAAVQGVLAQVPVYPDPVVDQAVYDEAEVLRADTKTQAETIIDGVEDRTGAEVVVYTRLAEPGITTEDAEADAQALMDQWGVGRRGFDDGLVILLDLHRGDTCHGQMQLYAGPGYRATFLTNQERQRIFDDDLLPLLRECDLDGAILTALAHVDANATPEHAATLERARQLDALLGLVGAPFMAVGLLAWGVWNWVRFGRDPVYLDDPSIHIPAPPPDLTPASAVLIREGRANRRALTTALLDLARRGELAFREEKSGLFGLGKRKVAVATTGERPVDPVEAARYDRARARPMDGATKYLDGRLDAVAGGDGYVDPAELLKLGQYVSQFDEKLERHVVTMGWFREPPGKATSRWIARGVVAVIAGGVGIFAGAELPSGGLVMLGVAAIVGGVVLFVLAGAMPARTMPGAMIRAMLEAYRRTLHKTMAQARSMGQVVEEAGIPLLESPDDAVVWGVALGLQEDVERVLARTLDDLRDGRVATGYLPGWYAGPDGGSGDGGLGGGSGGWAPGLMSGSAIPDFGGMMSALGTIGNSPSSSGSGGGFSGGGSGGGGGGSGGGF
jgi:uncharacterized membrane protein YgcG